MNAYLLFFLWFKGTINKLSHQICCQHLMTFISFSLNCIELPLRVMMYLKNRNKYFSIMLLVLLAVTQTGSILALLAFSGNRDFIANELCVNRFEPALECNGQCQLMKSVERAQESNTSESDSFNLQDQVHLFFLDNSNFTPSFLQPVHMANFPMPNHYFLSFSFSISPPPELV